ncbi:MULTISPECIES: type II toxin-antitoxin system HicB family antitoxin [Methylobacterium]|jgi:predicted RNase H-like HicB family nuclease|uniref:type II toxin-antitoxin system HicB family antitoxin n=1 Tax=Methylobacterium TaxID=407 RepID=UPI0008EC10F8|nr:MULTISPECIES: type II toxin-antitoxin system HicB family antitoxin [Methylobacterium]MBZ6412362.1 type II toxin-antitoxin system HicB family antitoxin [Methylobacterium sp.]MBK3400174.1 type II toxin-antitoxin system HicB family antitoxin [Methylobacterium ajmalii]MBK3410055.1 type II toxin-antitoxin system HicB family antitoxin [Methylobacterium ajmalii]MBK3425882.1 type II toxin-antitoxin system HicB family antitoxin [Methylobacterium ajmalii]SFE30285.1 Predicted nuclease of the RNAse H f
MTKVVMLIHGEPGNYGASFPDFPGATTGADDLDALYDKAAEMLAFHVGGMIEDGLEVPPTRSLDFLRDDPLFREEAADGMVGVLDVELPGKTVRVNLTMNESDLRRIDRAAAAAHETRSGWLVRAANARLRGLGPDSEEGRHATTR